MKPRLTLWIASAIGALLLVGPLAQHAQAIFALPEPYVSESTDGFGGTQYTIHNPQGSNVAVIGMLVSNNNPNDGRWVEETNWGWVPENQDVTQDNWTTRPIGDNSSRSTWEYFTTEIPFANLFAPTDNVMGYFVDHVSDEGNFIFTEVPGYGNALDNAVAEGEDRQGFFVNAPLMSDYVLIATDDLNDNLVEYVWAYPGQVVPEPATLAMMTLGTLILLLRKR